MSTNSKNINRPPGWADTLLEWFCKWKYLEEVQGDLLELFNRRAEKTSRFFNCFLYWVGVVKYFRPTYWKKNLFNFYNGGLFMFRSNLKFAIRNIRKNLFFSSINISGLAIGIGAVLFIFFYIQFETSYDMHFEKSDRIYQLYIDGHFAGRNFNTAEVGGITAPTIKKDYPEVENYVRLDERGIFYVRYGDITFKEYNIYRADSTFFDVFSIPVLQGDPETILRAPNSMAISKKIADKFFGSENPIGKTIYLDERETYTVTGVFGNIPQNTHFEIDLVSTFTGIDYINADAWTNTNSYSYIVLKENVDHAAFLAKLPDLTEKYVWPEVAKFGMDVEELKANGTVWDIKAQHLSEAHFDTKNSSDLKPATDKNIIYIFGAIAMFILIIASINFINLSTARSANRAKEVGIKKVVGSFRGDLITQFLTESVVLSFISLLLAILLVELLKPYFFGLIGMEFEISYLTNINFAFTLIAVMVLTGLVAGSFPAFVLSKFKPVAVLRGTMSQAMKKGWLRSSLVIFQFTASLTLIIGTLVIFNQLEYMQSYNLGFDKEQVLVIDDPYILDENGRRGRSIIFKEEIIKHSDVMSGTLSGYLPIDSYRNNNGVWRDGNKDDPKVRPQQVWRVDYDYFETLGIEFVKGRNFSRDFRTDSNAVIINRAMLEYCEWNDFNGHTLSRINNNQMVSYPIIGVVENFHFNSLKSEIEPVMFLLSSHSGYASFKIKGDIAAVVDYVETKWNEMAPGQPFSYKFMDEAFNKVYQAEMNVLSLFRVFAVLAVLIGCLGLFGLSAFTAEKRTKEIGIRKVHGASISNLIYLLSKEFSVLVIVAVLIASPVAYYLMERWLESYAYRIDIEAGTFLLSGFIALAIALVTVSYHAVKVSLINPAKSLKYE